MRRSPVINAKGLASSLSPFQQAAVLKLPVLEKPMGKVGFLHRGHPASRPAHILGVEVPVFNALVQRGIAWANQDGSFGLLHPLGIATKTALLVMKLKEGNEA